MKRIFLMLVIALTLPLVVSAQNATTVYRSVEQMPQFPGGEVALMKYIQSHLNYPVGCSAEGRVILQFVILSDGSISEVKVVRSVDEALDKEAVRVIKSLPNFTPGCQNGQPVAVWYTLPVSFKCTQVKDRDVNETIHSDVPGDTNIYRSVEQMPEFPGGAAALMKYIVSHVNRPEDSSIKGNVVLQFVVQSDGSIGEVKVVRSLDEVLDNEAVRVIKSLPNFTPGRQNGQPVAVWYTLPVPFDDKLSKMF